MSVLKLLEDISGNVNVRYFVAIEESNYCFVTRK